MPMSGQAESRMAQIPVNEPFTRLPATSWGEEVSSPRVGLSDRSRSLPSPSPLYFIHIRVCCVWLSPLDFSIASAGRHSSFSHGHPSGNARGGNTRACPSSRDYTRATPPVRARENHSLDKKLNSGIRNRVSSFSNLFNFIFFL
jgi:hypothetical protein